MVRRRSLEEEGFIFLVLPSKRTAYAELSPTMSLENCRDFPASAETIKPPRRSAVERKFLGWRASGRDALERCSTTSRSRFSSCPRENCFRNCTVRRRKTRYKVRHRAARRLPTP